MAESIKNQIDALTGFGSTEDLALQDWCEAGVKELINLMPDDMKAKCTTETTLNHSSETLDLDGIGQILYVTRLSADSSGFRVPCRKVDDKYGDLVRDSSNLTYYATATDPAYWISSSNDLSILNVFPTPTENQTAIVYHIGYTQVNLASSEIGNFPDEAQYLVVLYASIKALQRLMNNKNSALSTLAVTSAPPDSPLLSTVSFTASSLSISLTAPTAISLNTISYSDSTTVGTVAKVDISGNQPTYTQAYLDDIADSDALVSASSDGTTKLHRFREEFTSIGDLSITAVPPDTPSISSVEFSNVTGESIATTELSFSPTLNSGNSTPTYTSPAVGGVSESLTTSMDADSAGTGTDADFMNYSKWFTTLGEMIEDDEDIELASAQIEKINSYIQSYNIAMQDSLNTFNEDVAEYQVEFQKSVQNANHLIQERIQEAQLSQQANLQTSINNMQAIVSDNNNKVQKFQVEISSYQADVNKEVQEYQANWNKQFQEWSTYQRTVLQHYQLEIQNNLNEFNKDNAIYQANIQAELAKHNSDLQKALNQAQIDSQGSVKDLEAAIQDNNRKVAQYSAEAQHYATQVNEEVQEFTASMQSSLNEMQGTIADNSSKISKYQVEVADYQANVSTELQEYTTNLQKDTLDYGWYQSQYASLKNDYLTGITILKSGELPGQGGQG